MSGCCMSGWAGDCAESTTEAYARSLGLFLDWCGAVRLDWGEVPYQLGRFVYWVQRYDQDVPVHAQVPVSRSGAVSGVLAAGSGRADGSGLVWLLRVCWMEVKQKNPPPPSGT